MWKETIHDTLFIGHTEDDLNQELRTNTQIIFLNAEERSETSVLEIVHFFYHLMNNRRDQIRRAKIKHGMWFYVWHDRQASQLRFSLISDFHSELPFRAKIAFESLETIIGEFLYESNFPFSELEISRYESEEQRLDEDVSTFVLPVFKVQLL